jgi:hypothetical protein
VHRDRARREQDKSHVIAYQHRVSVRLYNQPSAWIAGWSTTLLSCLTSQPTIVPVPGRACPVARFSSPPASYLCSHVDNSFFVAYSRSKFIALALYAQPDDTPDHPAAPSSTVQSANALTPSRRAALVVSRAKQYDAGSMACCTVCHLSLSFKN